MTVFSLNIQIDGDKVATSADVAGHLRTLADRLSADVIPMVEPNTLSHEQYIAHFDRSIQADGQLVGSWNVEEPLQHLAQKLWFPDDFESRLEERINDGVLPELTESQKRGVIDSLTTSDCKILTNCDDDWVAVDIILDDVLRNQGFVTSDEEDAE